MGGGRNRDPSGHRKRRVLALGADVGDRDGQGTVIKALDRALLPSQALAKHLPCMKPFRPRDLVRLVLTIPVSRNARSEVPVDFPEKTLDAQLEF